MNNFEPKEIKNSSKYISQQLQKLHVEPQKPQNIESKEVVEEKKQSLLGQIGTLLFK